MLQILIGLFSSYRDGNDALQALQALGLTSGNGHLYHEQNIRESASGLHSELSPDLFSQERAEYAAHGECLGVYGAANRYSTASFSAASTEEATPVSDTAQARTLLVIEDICGLGPVTACEVLFDHGAVAVKDPSGHWRFSPRQNVRCGQV